MAEQDQIEKCVVLLKKCPYTRRAKIDIWNKAKDLNDEHAPCLQYMSLRIENGKLNMNAHMRSNDLFRAAFMNMYAFTELQNEIAKRLGVISGSYTHVADSEHEYGSTLKDVEGFIKTMHDRNLEDRVWPTSFAVPMFIEGLNEILAEPNLPQDKRELVLKRKAELELQNA
jgi:thymidylate synthase